jgi:hypothetical protein
MTKLERRRLMLRLALETDADLRTVERACREGIEAIRGAALRERLAKSTRALGVTLPLSEERP